MAIAGGATTAYKCSLQNGKLRIDHTTAAGSICVAVADAVPAILGSATVIVAGSDMWQLQCAFRDQGIEIERRQYAGNE